MLATVILASVLFTGLAHAARDKLGKIYVKADSAEVNGQKFADKDLEDSVKDLKKQAGDFIVVNSESDADFLLVAIKREVQAKSGQPSDKILTATLSVRDGTTWKAGTKLSSNEIFWGQAAYHVMKDAAKWVKASRKN
jgi:hypothetical protein